MSFQAELGAAARGLARLAVHGSAALTGAELDAALYARATLLDLARLVHRDLTGASSWGPRLAVAGLETDPVRTFYQALRAHRPVPARAAPSDVLSIDPPSRAGRLWKDTARHALHAHHLWQTGTLTRPADAAAWAGVTDVAAVAAVVAELDAELAVAARGLGRTADADRLTEATTSGLRTAAREAAALASSGPLAATGPEPRPAPRREVVPVRTPQDAVAAQRQLAVLLRSAAHLRPERVALITLGHQRTVDAVLRTWQQLGTAVAPGLHRALRDHLGLLTEATGRRWGAASLDGGDPFPLHQANLLRQALHPDGAVLRGLLADSGPAREFLTAVADTTFALSEVTRTHLQRRVWLRPHPEDGALRWSPATSWHDVPGCTQALHAAAVQATHLTTELSNAYPPHADRPRPVRVDAAGPAPGHRPAGPDAGAAMPVSARNALAPAPRVPLLARTTPPRPPRPGIPPRPAAPSHVDRARRR